MIKNLFRYTLVLPVVLVVEAILLVGKGITSTRARWIMRGAWDRTVGTLRLLVRLIRMAFGLLKMVRQCGIRQASLILSEASMAALGHAAQGLEAKIRARIA